MNRFNFLSRLLNFEPANGPFTSVYLDTGANETGKKDFDVFLKKQISEWLDTFEKDAPERQKFENDCDTIRKYLADLEPAVQGVAVFACSAAGLFRTFEFHIPFEQNFFFVFDRPHLYPLIKLVSQNRRFVIAQADTNSAHVYLVRRGEIIERDDIQNVKTNRTEVGGWSQMRFQRHIENFHKQHAKEVVAELDKIVRDERIEMVVLAGDETVIIPLLRDEMSKELEDKVVGVLPLNVHTPEHEVLEEAQKLVNRHDTLKDMEKLKLLEEQNYEGGRGVTSVGRVLTALLNGQVQELYIAADFGTIDYDVSEVNRILKDYSPGVDEALPGAKRAGLVIDELLKLAAGSAEDIRFIEDENLLKAAGGVGALLRYQAKGVTNV
jgi:peptide chain release factor subunit 1